MGHTARPDMQPFSIKRLDSSCQTMTFPTPTIRSIVHCFAFLTKGEILIESEGKNILMKQNEMLLIPQSVPYSIQHYKNCLGYVGGFHNSFLGSGVFCQTEIRQIKLLQYKNPVKCPFEASQATLTDSLFTQIVAEFNQEKRNNDLIKCMMMSILAIANTHVNTTGNLFTEDLCDMFLRQLFNEEEPVKTIPSYADSLKVSPNHLNKTVKKATGKTLSQWIDDSIIIRSKTLLCETQLSVAEIAEKMQILDPSYFTRKFKKHTLFSPLEYRKRFGNK